MATIQQRNDSWRILFKHNGKQYAVTIGKVSETEAIQWKGRAELLLMQVKQNLLEVPRGISITGFIQHDGKPPVDPELHRHRDTTLHQLREAYEATFSNGSIEANTLYTAGIHLNHIEETFGKGFILSGLTLGKLQSHINRRKDVSPVTIKKEMDTFRGAWNWGFRMKWVDTPFPAKGLMYPKTDEKLPFMSWEEIERRIKAGGDATELWECLYLRPEQTAELLTYVKAKKKAPHFVYPMILAAAHTGARRSELIRAKLQSVDLANKVWTIHEKKRARGTRTTRRVPISEMLATALKELMKRQEGTTYLFGAVANRAMSVQATHKALWRALKKSKWSVVKGYHTLRHSFISACASKGIDQRIVDEWVGHSTEQQRRRYRHLFPQVQADALSRVFG